MSKSKPPRYHLTRLAARNLRDIYAHSHSQWGETTAREYIADLYAAMDRAAADPESGRLRQQRSLPFLMVPARQHFVIYDRMPQGIVILTVQHKARDIETLIATLTPSFLDEIDRLKRSRRKTE